jgi:TRAP-type C4-dicarboxylate transport system permease small subunit
VPFFHDTAEKGWSAGLVRLYESVTVVVAASAMTLLVVIMGVQVFYRYALNSSLIWAEEVCRYLLIVMTFLLIGAAFQRGEMVSVQFFTRLLPWRIALLVMVPIYLAMTAFLVVVGYFGYQFATFNAHFSMPAMDFIFTALAGREVRGALSMYWIYMLIPVGCLILGLHFLAAMVKSLRAAIGAGDAP